MTVPIIKVAAVIVTWNKLNDVCLVIEDTTKLDLSGIKLDIFVVDNASTDGTQAYIEQNYPLVQVLQTSENLGGSGGFSYGLNFVRELEYDFIWLLDNDVRLDTQSLLPLTKTLSNHSEVGLVGSQIRKLDEPNIIQEIGACIYPKKAHVKTYFGNTQVVSNEEILLGKPYLTVDMCAAASLLVRREVVQQIGVFENYFLHFDDVEWCLRALQHGWIVAANPQSIVWHASPDFKFRPWVSYYDERNICYCWQKHRPELVWKRFLVVLPKLIHYSVTGRFFWSQLYLQAYQDFFDGIQGKMPNYEFYKEESLQDITGEKEKITIQDSVYQYMQDTPVFQKLLLDKNIEFQKYPANFSSRIWTWLISRGRKSSDLAIVNCYKPDIYSLITSKKVYVFTGKGYVLVTINIFQVFQYVCIIAYQIFLYVLKYTCRFLDAEAIMLRTDKRYNCE